MLVQICDICEKENNNIQSYKLPFCKKKTVSSDKYGTPIIEFENTVVPMPYDLCDKCAKKFFKSNLMFLLGEKEKDGLLTVNIKYDFTER